MYWELYEIRGLVIVIIRGGVRIAKLRKSIVGCLVTILTVI